MKKTNGCRRGGFTPFKKRRMYGQFIVVFLSAMLIYNNLPVMEVVHAEEKQDLKKDKAQTSEVDRSVRQESSYELELAVKDLDRIDLEFKFIYSKEVLVGSKGYWFNTIDKILKDNQSSFEQVRSIVVKGGEMNWQDIDYVLTNTPNIEVFDIKKVFSNAEYFTRQSIDDKDRPSISAYNNKLKVLKLPKGKYSFFQAPTSHIGVGVWSHPTLEYLDLGGADMFLSNVLTNLNHTTKIVLPKKNSYFLDNEAFYNSRGISYASNDYDKQEEISLYNVSEIGELAFRSDAGLDIHKHVNLIRFGGTSKEPIIRVGSLSLTQDSNQKFTVLSPKSWKLFPQTLKTAGHNAVAPSGTTNGDAKVIGSTWEVSFDESLFNGFYPVELQVYKDGNLVSYTPEKGEEHTFVIDSLSTEDFGTYTFEMKYEVHPDETGHVEDLGHLMEVASAGKHTLKQMKFEIESTQNTVEIDSELYLSIATDISESGVYEWKSSDEEIATVDANGVVKAKKKGIVTITLKDTANNLTAEKDIEVVDILELEHIPESINLEDIIAITKEEAIMDLWEWDKEYFEEDKTDGLKLVSIKAGDTTITLKDTAGFKKTKKVAIRSLVIDKHKPTINLDEAEPLTLLKSHNDFSQLVWSSEDENIAKVNQDGVVTGVALGTTTITIKDMVYNTTTSTTIQVAKPLIPVIPVVPVIPVNPTNPIEVKPTTPTSPSSGTEGGNEKQKAATAVASGGIKTGDQTNVIALIGMLSLSILGSSCLNWKRRKG